MSDERAQGTEPPRPPAAPARRRRRLLAALAAAVLAAVGLRAALPFLVARGLEEGARRSLGMPLRVAEVDLGLLRGRAELRGLEVGRAVAAAPVDPFFRLGRLAAQIVWSDLLAGRIHLRELAFEDPVVRLARRADGTLESPLPPPTAPEAPAPAPEGEPRSYSVDRLRLVRLDLALSQAGRDDEPIGFALEALELADVVMRGDDLTLGGVDLRGPRLQLARDVVFAPAPEGPPGGPPPAAANAPEPPAPAAEPPPAPAAEPPPAGAAGPHYRLGRVEIERAGFALLGGAEPIELELDLRAREVSAAPDQTFPLELVLRVGGGEVRAEGRAGLAPPTFEGALRWRALPVPLFVLAARPELVPWVRSCEAEGDLALHVRLAPGSTGSEPAGVRAAGSFAVRDLALADPKDAEVGLRWKALEIALREASLPLGAGAEPIRVALERVHLDRPELRYGRPSPALEALLGGAPAAGAEAPVPAAAPEAPPEEGARAVELAVGALEVARGVLRFEDATLATRFEGRLRELSLAARELRWPALRARRVRLRGVAPENAPFSLQGDLDGARGAFAFEIQRLELPRFDAYAAGAGYRLLRGEASLASSLRLEPERYVAENDLLIHDLRLDAADAGAFERQLGTPLDLALALLRDPAGDIRLPVPITLERDAVQLGLGSAVLGALRAALVGVVSSPLKALGAALPRSGASEVDLAALPAEPGAAEPTAEGAARLEALATLLASRPLLAVALAGRAGPEDRPLLAERWLVERASAGEPLPEVQGASFLARRRLSQALAARGRGEAATLSPDDDALLTRMRDAAPVPPERFSALAAARAAAARDHLLARGLGAGRATLEPPAEGPPGVAVELAAHLEPEA